jgi:hypothetical protein
MVKYETLPHRILLNIVILTGINSTCEGRRLAFRIILTTFLLRLLVHFAPSCSQDRQYQTDYSMTNPKLDHTSCFAYGMQESAAQTGHRYDRSFFADEQSRT